MRSLPDMLEMERTVFRETFSGADPEEQAFFQSLFPNKEEEASGLQGPVSGGDQLISEERGPFPNMEAFELFSEEEEKAVPEEEPEPEGQEEIPPPPPEKSEEELRIEAMRQEAENALREAKETARAAREQACREAEEIKAKARDQGFSEGRAAGFETGQQEGRNQIRQELLARYQILFQSADQAVNDLENQKREFSQTYLEDLRDLVMTVAEKVISVSLKSSGKVIEGMMRDAVGARQAKRLWANVSISEQDYQSLLENGITPETVLEETAEQVRLTVVEKAEAGTCLIEFPEEIIDASVSTQIANIKKMMRNIGNTA